MLQAMIQSEKTHLIKKLIGYQYLNQITVQKRQLIN